jgi:hypothetical protein
MDDEKDTLLLVSKNDKNHLVEKELLQVSKLEKIENLQPNLLFLRGQKINYYLITEENSCLSQQHMIEDIYNYYSLLTFNYSSSYYGKITKKMILCERKDTHQGQKDE